MRRAIFDPSLWTDVVGRGFAANVRPVAISGGALHVDAPIAWRVELLRVEPIVVDRLRSRGIVVERVECLASVEAPR